MRSARLAAVALVGLGVVVYSAWLLEFLLPTGVSPVQQSVEALLPASPLFRVTTGIAGLAFALACPPLLRLVPVHWTGRVAAITLAFFGLVLIADALVPGTSAAQILENLAFVGGSFSLVFWWPPPWREWAVAGFALVLITWALVLIASLLGPGHLVGVFSRVQVGVRAALMGSGVAYIVIRPLPRFASRAGR
ncbi:hypothetical protein VSH64_43575 [Amycolatopsis rhabdoformis]|uniref:DUF998 domain-containing protein n=1 Tax=Amycolatopsis rhabdoformis TaxID=1448059 RepID=A0ABZ1I5A2_9PSEU|nr:hypothetical protein [Amycolatopsis rhabdoformis]WSE29609.1 hypothetical protein VSH64_43575 [Amycolatopsis rhabdoformis]